MEMSFDSHEKEYRLEYYFSSQNSFHYVTNRFITVTERRCVSKSLAARAKGESTQQHTSWRMRMLFLSLFSKLLQMLHVVCSRALSFSIHPFRFNPDLCSESKVVFNLKDGFRCKHSDKRARGLDEPVARRPRRQSSRASRCT